MDSPKLLSRILLYIIAEDFLCTIRWVMAWYFLLNSFSLCVDSIDADLFSGGGISSASKWAVSLSDGNRIKTKIPDSFSFFGTLVISPTKTHACFLYSPK